MAAYAALVSVLHIIEQIQHHPRPPFSLENSQLQPLTENVAFFQDFLERYPNCANALECRIADAAYAAEDVIESHIVDQISGSKSGGEKISSIDLYQGLHKVIQDMGFIKKEVMGIEEKSEIKNQLSRNSSPADSLSSPYNAMMGFDDLFFTIMDKLTGGELGRQIISIYGMGGIGKTTLARNTFVHETIVQHFDIRSWVTISQQYSTREVLLEINCQENKEYRERLSGKDGYELGEILYKRLCGRRYMIVMDDMWGIDVWDEVNRFFPDNNNGSRIFVTTRLSSVAFQLSSHGLEVNFLDEDESWNLLCKNVFGEEGCPLELEEMGKKIARNCKGLPLSIVVIGRVLAKSNQTQMYWEYIAENLSSIVNLEDNEHCLNILSLSYNQLPAHLKPCFLYMGVFREGRVIRVSLLIKLWVVEGFLKPIKGKNLEVVAEEYLMDLIDRNLIFIHKKGSTGKIKFCNIHDLLRDVCLRQAQREKFICVADQYNPDINTQRRVAFHQRTSRRALQSLESTSLVRSLICDSVEDLPLLDLRLLRVLNPFVIYTYGERAASLHSLEAIFSQLVNLRYLSIPFVDLTSPHSEVIPFPLNLLWNVHTLIVNHMVDYIAPSEIWEMPQLRHVEFWSLELPDLPSDAQDDFILENLQTLVNIKNLRCSEEVVKRIPNIKKLGAMYHEMEGCSLSCLHNLGRLELESLKCDFFSTINGREWSDLLQNLTFPRSLKKLALEGCGLSWDDITTKIGSLPLLQVLKLGHKSTKGHEWETVEEGFPKLKFLKIGSLRSDLESWITDSTHFPVLEHLVLQGLPKMESVPKELGDISTLKLIELFFCSDHIVSSAKEILDEQEELGNVDLQVRGRILMGNEELESLQSRNFQVEAVLPKRSK